MKRRKVPGILGSNFVDARSGDDYSTALVIPFYPPPHIE